MFTNEVIITKDSISAADWRKIALIIGKHTGRIKAFSLSVVFRENIIKFYVHSRQDISGLSNGLEGILLRPVVSDEAPWEVPANAKKLRFLRIPTGGNVFDLKERYKVQTNKELKVVCIEVRRYGERMTSKFTAALSIGEMWYVTTRRLALFPAHLFEINFTENSSYIRASLPVYVSLEKTLHLLQTDDLSALFRIPAFPYAPHDYFLHLPVYEFDKHSLIVGASGSGKSKLIQLIIDRISRLGIANQQYRVVVIDPHAALEEDLRAITGANIVNLGNESAQLFPDASADVSAATELTTTLFKSLLADQYNPKLERVLRFSVYVLLTAQIMSLEQLKLFLTDLEFRTKVLGHVEGYVPHNLQKFFATDFNELRTQSYTEAILPIVSLVDEMQLQPSLVGEAAQSLASTLQQNFLTVFSLNKVTMGEKAVKTVAGLLIQQIFLIAQSRIVPQKILLFIDEVSVVQNPALANILAEARKFNLFVILTQQYFGQIDKDIKDAILSNVVNYYVFRISEEDAASLEANLIIELPKEMLEQAKAKGLKEGDVKRQLMTSLSPRECLLRVSANGQLMPCIKARTADALEAQPSLAHALPGRQSGARDLKQLPPKMVVAANDVESTLKALQAAPTETQAMTKPLVENASFAGPGLQQLLSQHSSSRKKLGKEVK